MQDSATPRRYEIQVDGTLDHRWSDWFAGLDVVPTGHGTVLSGLLSDQAALHGVLNRIRDVDLFLISVRCLDVDAPQPPA